MMTRGSSFAVDFSLPTLPSSLRTALKVAAMVGATLPGPGANVQAAVDATEGQRTSERTLHVVPGEYVAVRDAAEMVESWTPARRLFINGDLSNGRNALNLTPEQATELATWLENLPNKNWTVYITDSVAREQYRDADGIMRTGFEAAIYRIGVEIQKRPGFEKIVDEGSGIKTGSIIVLSFDVSAPDLRKIDISGGDLYDRHNLGEANWKGNLDRTALPLLREKKTGQAIRDTITTLDGKLAQALQREQEQVSLVRERATREVQAAKDAFAELNAQLVKFRERNPGKSGSLAFPETSGWQSKISEGESGLRMQQFNSVSALVGGIAKEVGAHRQLLDGYPAAEKKLNQLSADLTAARADEYAKRVASLEVASKLLDVARADWDRAESSYQASLTAAETEVPKAIKQIGSARSADETAHNLMLGGIGVVALLGLGGTGIAVARASRRSQKAKEGADELLKRWDDAIGEKTGAMLELNARRMRLLGDPNDKTKYFEGETGKMAEEVHKAFGALWIRITQARHRLDDAKATFASGGNLSTTKYEEVRELLSDRPILFERGSQAESVLREASGQERDEAGVKLFGTLRDYEPFSLTFDELINQFNASAKSAKENLDLIEEREANVSRDLAVFETSLKSQQGAIDALRAHGKPYGLFELAGYPDDFTQRASKAVSELQQLASRDPVGAHGRLAEWKERLGTLEKFVQQANTILVERGPALVTSQKAIAESKIEVGWVAEGLTSLSRAADALCVELGKDGASSEAATKIIVGLNNLFDRVELGATLSRESTKDLSEALRAAEGRVSRLRAELGAAFKLNAEQMMTEKGSNPSERLTAAHAEKDRAVNHIAVGALEDARKALTDSRNLVRDAEQIVANSRRAFEEYVDVAAKLTSDHQKLVEEKSTHVTTLASITQRFHPDVLVLGSGDPTHPNGNGMLGDNVEEAEQTLTQMAQHLTRAAALYKNGEVLGARAVLAQADGCREFAAHRYAEIEEKWDRLGKVSAQNGTLIESSAELVRQLTTRGQDDKITAATVGAIAELSKSLSEISARTKGARSNPFAIADQLATLNSALIKMDQTIEKDIALFREAVRSVDAARTQLAGVRESLKTAAKDSVTDSSAIESIRGQIDGWAGKLEQANLALKRPHGEWSVIDQNADRIASEVTTAQATMRKELEAAQEAINRLQSARRAVSEAQGWSGSYGVVIGSVVGADIIGRARAALEQGRYDEALKEADRAARTARAAVESAEREVATRQRRAEEEERRERQRRQDEEDRRRRARDSDSSSSSGSTWGGSSSGFSGGSSFSGGASSGFSGGSSF